MSKPLHGKSPEIDEFVSALGIPIKNLKAFSIEANAGEIVTVKATYNLHDGVLREFYGVFKKYKLVPVEDKP